MNNKYESMLIANLILFLIFVLNIAIVVLIIIFREYIYGLYATFWLLRMGGIDLVTILALELFSILYKKEGNDNVY